MTHTYPAPRRYLPALRLPPGIVRGCIAALAILLTVWTQWGPPPASVAFGNELLRDRFLKLQKTDSPEPRVLVVDIDESSTAELGPWPWPRERIADLVELLLTEYGVRGVALDIVMPEPSDPVGDQRVAMLAEHGPVVLAQAFDFQKERPRPLRDGALGLASTLYPASGAVATGYIGNHALLARASKVGNIGFIPDADGVLRRVPLITTFEGKAYPSLALALLNCCSGKPPLQLEQRPTFRVSFERDWNAYTIATAAEILKRDYHKDAFRGRLVVIGSSSLGQGDRLATPLGNSRPGLGVQAAVLSMLLDVQAGTAPARWPGGLLATAFAVLSALLATFAFPRLSAIWSVGLLAATSAAWLLVAYHTAPHDPDFSTTGPLATNLFLLAFAVPYQWQLTQRRSRHLLDTLRQYVAPKVVEELLRSDVDEPLKPRQLEVTTLIADMEGYTAQVESLPVEDAASLTRDFLDCLTGPVIELQGTLDKYTGDGLVAFWGAPLPIAQHADLALDAARAILVRVEALSQQRMRDGHPPLRVRVGMESGPAMAGDFGTSFRSIYTAVGDSVNTASRLEQAARDFPHDVIIGAGTVARSERHHFLFLGERLLRGKENPTLLYSFDPNMYPVASAINTVQNRPMPGRAA